MATKQRRRTRSAEDDPVADQEKRVAEGVAETQEHLDATEKLHRDAERRGAALEPHKQPPPHQPGVVQSDRVAEGEATVRVEVGRGDEPVDVDQEKLGMGPLKFHGGKRGAPAQPPSRTAGTHTVSSTVGSGGRPLQFVGGAAGMTGEGAKVSGGSKVLSGGAGTGGTVLADLPASGNPPALPVFSDRVITDADMGGPGSGVVPSGAPNLPRAEAPRHESGHQQIVKSDRLLEPGEPGVVIATPEALNRETPHSGGGEALGMGATHYHGYGKAVPKQAETNEAKAVKTNQKRSPKARAKASKESGREASADLDTKVQRVKDTPQAETVLTDKEDAPPGMEIETKDVKSNPSTEQKDRPVETGTKSPPPAEPPKANP